MSHFFFAQLRQNLQTSISDSIRVKQPDFTENIEKSEEETIMIGEGYTEQHQGRDVQVLQQVPVSQSLDVVSNPLQERLYQSVLLRNSLRDGCRLIQESVSVPRVEFVVYLSCTPLGQGVQAKERRDGDDVVESQAGGQIQLAGVDIVDKLDESLTGDKVEIESCQTLEAIIMSWTRCTLPSPPSSPECERP